MLHGTASFRRLLLRLENAPKEENTDRRRFKRSRHARKTWFHRCGSNISSPPLYNIYCRCALRSPAERMLRQSDVPRKEC